LLTTTRAVRRRLDLERPVDRGLLADCVRLAVQAPSPSDEQPWHFVVVTDPARRAALADLYRAGAAARNLASRWALLEETATDAEDAARHRRRAASGRFLLANLHRVPALVIPCVEGRPDGLAAPDQA